MESEEDKVKRLVAFSILMQHDEGIMSKSPDYIREKFAVAMSLPVDLLYQMFYDQGAKLQEYYKKHHL